MKVVLGTGTQPNRVKLTDLRSGQIGVTEDKEFYLKTEDGSILLNDSIPNNCYSDEDLEDDDNPTMVEVLSRGMLLTITVE